jgi:hypothetical protein
VVAVGSTDPVDEVVWMVRGVWVTMCLSAGCRLGVFDALHEPVSAAALSAACRADEHALTRLLSVLADVGVVERLDDGRYVNSPRGQALRADHPSQVRELVLMQTWAPHVAAWTRAADAVRTGAGVFEAANGQPMWELLSAHPEVEQQFNGAMARRADGQVAAVLAATDLVGVRTVVDVGGGRGALLEGLLRADPDLTGVVADRPDVAAEAETTLAAHGFGERAHGVAADFFSSVPDHGDLYTICNVLHDWDDDDCVAILRTVHAAMGPDSRLLVVERVLGVAGRGFEAARDLHLVDLHMLVTFGARERTFEEYADLLRAAGFPSARLTGTGPDWNVVEASAWRP